MSTFTRYLRAELPDSLPVTPDPHCSPCLLNDHELSEIGLDPERVKEYQFTLLVESLADHPSGARVVIDPTTEGDPVWIETEATAEQAEVAMEEHEPKDRS
jgi:hypothetical protein